MEFTEWAPYYDAIRREFGFRMERERASADRLLALLSPASRADPLARLRARLEDREVVVVGLAPRAGAPPLWRLPPGRPRVALVAADGAARRCLDAGLVPEVIVTDLDGPVASEVLANSKGAFVLVHAHGDNVPELERWVPEFSGEVGGSWAGPPEPGLLDVGGFTDGDRAACLAVHLRASRVLLWGFDFERTEEEDTQARAVKLAKLAWARRVVAVLARGKVPVRLWRPDGTIVPYPEPSGPSTQ